MTVAPAHGATDPVATRADGHPAPSGGPIPVQAGPGMPGPRVQFFLAMSANFGMVSPGDGWYDAGAVVPITATPPAGSTLERYRFQSWTGDYNGTSPSGVLTMDGNKTIQAVWIHQFRNTVQSNPVIQSIDIDGVPTATPVDVWWAEGSNHVLTAPRSVAVSADTRLNFASWIPGGSPNTAFAISGVQFSVTYTATFSRQYRVTLVTSPAPGPIVLVDGSLYTVPVWFDDGTVHTFDAAPCRSSAASGSATCSWSGTRAPRRPSGRSWQPARG